MRSPVIDLLTATRKSRISSGAALGIVGVVQWVMGKTIRFSVVAIEDGVPDASADPEPALTILVHGPDRPVAEAVRIVGIVPVDAESIAIVAIQPVLGGKPHKAHVVLEDVDHGALRKPILDGKPVKRDATSLTGPSGRGLSRRG